MADIAHASLTGANLHEPKGVDAAVANRVYLSNGAGSGAWLPVVAGNHADAYINNNATATTIPAASDSTLSTDADYRKITAGWILAHQAGVIGFSTDQFTVTQNGDYTVDFWASIIGGNGSVSGVKFVKNNATPYYIRKHKVTHTSATNLHIVSFRIILVGLVSGDTISVYAANTAGNITVQQAGFLCELAHAN